MLTASALLLSFVGASCAARPPGRAQAGRAVTRQAPSGSGPEAPGGAIAPASVTVVDLSPRFLAFYDSATARRLDPDPRWVLWKRLYGFAAVPPTPFGDTLARRLLDGAWPRYPAALPRIRQGAAALGLTPNEELRHVIALLGCGGETRVRLIVFVGAFDENAFAFTSPDGMPTIAIPLEAGDARRSLIHELTHAVHRSRGCADIRSGYAQSLAELVVSEGVAMRAVERLLPGRPATYYIIATQDWLERASARRATILRGIGEHLTERSAATAQRFTLGDGTTGLPREAYYAGWEVVGALLRSGMSLHQVATTPPDRLPALILRGIDRLATEGGEHARAPGSAGRRSR